MYLGQQQDHAGSPATSSTPTGQPQRKPVGRWFLAGSVERPGVVGPALYSFMTGYYYYHYHHHHYYLRLYYYYYYYQLS